MKLALAAACFFLSAASTRADPCANQRANSAAPCRFARAAERRRGGAASVTCSVDARRDPGPVAGSGRRGEGDENDG